jgi:hypothetical protein
VVRVEFLYGMDSFPVLHYRSKTEVKEIMRRCVAPILHNVVATAVIRECPEQSGGADAMAKLAWQCGGKQNRREFAAPATLKLRDCQRNEFTFSVFSEQSIVLTGGSNENTALYGIWEALLYIGKCTGKYYIPRGITIRNIQATFYMFAYLDLAQIHKHWPLSQYNEESIKTVKIAMTNPRVTCLIYLSGSGVLTGASKRSQLVEAYNKLIPFLAQFVIRFVDDEQERQRIRERTEQIMAKIDATDEEKEERAAKRARYA